MLYKYLKIFFLLVITILYCNSCMERSRDNPLDPKTNDTPELNLRVLSYNDRVELSWNKINITDYLGFNIYRKNHPDSSFQLIASDIQPGSIRYIDLNISYQIKLSYYITIQGVSDESLPSNEVSITPGQGYNWIVDKWGYQVYKTTYDNQYSMKRFYTDWSPQDIAIDPDRNVALITQPAGRRMDIIETEDATHISTISYNDYSFIDNPYLVEYEPSNRMFWISDSGGFVYRASSSNYSINLITSEIVKPDELFINQNNRLVYIVDDLSNHIYRFNLNGNFTSKFNGIGDYVFRNPQKIVFDAFDNQFWLIDKSNDQYYLLTGFINNMQITPVDTFDYAFDMHLNPNDQNAWISVNENGIFKVLQLSKAGIRLTELTGFYNPYHVTHNPYDGTLLVTDSGNRRTIHFNGNFDKLGIFTNLNFPIRLEVE